MPTVYVADTVALARYFEDRLPSKAEKAFREAERGDAVVLVPDIVIGEFVYIALKGRLKASDPRAVVRQLLDEVHASSHLRLAPMNEAAWDRFLESGASELHDRMISSLASAHGAVGIITNDDELKSADLATIW